MIDEITPQESAAPPQPPTGEPADMSQDAEFHHEGKMSFDADSRYADKFHSDAYDPETYNYMKGMYAAIQNHLDSFIIEYPQFDSLRTMDVEKLRIGDNVAVSNASDKKIASVKACNIKSIDHGTYTLTCGNTEIKVETRDLKVIDDPILRLKGTDISFMYTTFKKAINIESHVDFFYTFTEYFKMNEKQVYDALSPRVKNEVLEELNERTGCLKKKNVFDW